MQCRRINQHTCDMPFRLRKLACPLIGLLTAVAAASTPVAAQTEDAYEDQRQRFLAGWEAAGRGQLSEAEQALEGLADYPLAPYLRYELMRQRIDKTQPELVEAFLNRYPDWSFSASLTRRWMDSLARRGLDELLLKNAGSAESAEMRCRIDRIRLERGNTDGLAERVRKLWLNPTSQPAACDRLFDWWRRQGNPSTDDAWQRFSLAIESNEAGLARYLRRYLDPRDHELADAWLRLARRPGEIARIASSWPNQERARRLIAWSLHRLASGDWSRAAALHRRLNGQFDFESEEIGPALHRIALFQAIDLDIDALATIDELDAAWIDDQLLAWRARAALAHGQWDEVLNSIYRMSADSQQDQRWRYWQARALQALGRPQADAMLVNLSREATYYGFLSALRIDQPLALCSRELIADGPTQRALYRDPQLIRALELHRADLGWHAPWTWQRAVDDLSASELEQAALIAASAGWHDRVVAALAQADALDAYPWRFPLVWRELVQAAGKHYGVDTALIFGLMRAESALQPDARSSAGARGLLQLMPGTARAVAQRNGLPYRSARDLYRPASNINLGSAHLSELQRRFEGDWTRVAAAYNAGIRHAERWHKRGPDLPRDIWIETLSFHETRDYVPRVLAFATIYEWQLDRPARVMAKHLVEQESQTRFACGASEPPAAHAAP